MYWYPTNLWQQKHGFLLTTEFYGVARGISVNDKKVSDHYFFIWQQWMLNSVPKRQILFFPSVHFKRHPSLGPFHLIAEFTNEFLRPFNQKRPELIVAFEIQNPRFVLKPVDSECDLYHDQKERWFINSDNWTNGNASGRNLVFLFIL